MPNMLWVMTVAVQQVPFLPLCLLPHGRELCAVDLLHAWPISPGA